MFPAYEIERIKWYAGLHAFLHAHDQFKPFHDKLPDITRGEIPSFRDLTILHHNVLKQIFANPALTELFCRAVDYYNREILKQPQLPPPPEPGGAENLHTMREQGYTFLPQLDEDRIRDMRDYLSAQPVLDHKTRTEMHIEEARQHNHVATIPERQVINCPHLFEILLSPEVINLVGATLGATPVLINLASWWSFARPGEAREAQLFHMDVDDYRFCKLFIYLTDVDEETGPHTYVPTTHRLDVIEAAQARARDPSAFVKWYVESLRKTDEEVAHHFGIEPVKITGPAGSRMLVNTFGLHKGTKPERADRLLCQATFGITTAQSHFFEPITPGQPGTENIWSGAIRPPHNFVTRLYFQGGS
ncbi:phytanoyl-CoA dioxygenase family protein [Aestuariispira insulae]|uniref:Phytanoyl-CoA dioxygenase PhyH n=1 Tax=Aestuariispira insulae TaxID=1461337 RepID=A0A3D9HL98_9PROT|nr:phytanoyl-CoA dioxygenase family protein [Aestuariispira insulae]RED49676.1 phytanoyl-CoA dioxygenase PhyH [Aestuariispira insulae]